MSNVSDTVAQDKLKSHRKKPLQLSRTTADEHRIKDIAQWLIDENETVTMQTVAATVEHVVYNEDDFTDDEDGPDIEHIGCIKVATPTIDFPILPTAGSWIHPLDAQVRSYPIVGEMVGIVNYGGQTFYFQPLNTQNRVSHNIALNFKGDSSATGNVITDNVDDILNHFAWNKKPRPVKQYPGDWALNGRNDQSIRLGTNFKTVGDTELNPYNAVIKMRISPESPKSIPAGTTRIEDIDTDKASFYMTRDEEIKYKVSPSAPGTTDQTTVGAPAIILDSDRIIFNTKESEVTGQINLFAGNTVNIVSKNNTNIIGSLVKLGDTNDSNLQSAVLGEGLVDFLAELIQTLDSFAGRIAGITGIGNVGGGVPIPEGMAAGNALGGWTSIQANKNFIKHRILSKNVKISKIAKPGL